MDKIVAKDQEAIEKGETSIIEVFSDETTKGFVKAGVAEGEKLYLDKHVIGVNTEKNIPKDLHCHMGKRPASNT